MSLVPGSGWFFAAVEVLLGLAATALFFYLVWARIIKMLSQGKSETRWDKIPDRVAAVIVNVLGQRKLLLRPVAGVAHFAIFWGFMILGLTIANFLLSGIPNFLPKLGISLMQAPILHLPFTLSYAWYHFAMDTFILLVLIAMAYAFYRRLIIKPKEMELSSQALMILGLISAMMITDLMISGAEIRMGELMPGGYLSRFTAAVWAHLGVPQGEDSGARWVYAVSWWLHFFVFFGFLNFLPLSKHQHIMAAPFNVFLGNLGPQGRVEYIPGLEEQEKWGVNSIPEFTWKQLLDGVTCQECGRCEVMCPANITGKPLSPKKLHLDLKHMMLEEGFKMPGAERKPLIGTEKNQQSTDEIWACTTCRACQYECPVMNEHIQKIVDYRRYLTLMEGNLPSEGQVALQNIEKNSNPWGIGFDKRAEWAADLEVPNYAEGAPPDTEYCFYVGCAGSFDERYKKIARGMVKILRAAGVKFAILGIEEQCCGDTARRLGNEYLYQILATQNMQTMAGYGVKKIVTCCPHGYNTIKNEYAQFIEVVKKENPEFKWEVEVKHSSELIGELISAGKLKLPKTLSLPTTLHDSCYLGRHNELYDQPRNVLNSLGLPVTEMKRSRGRSFCCGAGGGRMWLEEHGEEKIFMNRTKEAIALGVKQIAVACPFCLTMFEDGVKQLEKEDVKVLDIVELVAGALEMEEAKKGAA